MNTIFNTLPNPSPQGRGKRGTSIKGKEHTPSKGGLRKIPDKPE